MRFEGEFGCFSATAAEYAGLVIIVVGQLLFRAAEEGGSAEGLAARIGFAAASAGRSVQLVGKTGEDPEGDAVLLGLTHGGVSHVAVLRDAGVTTPHAHGTIEARCRPDG